MNTHLPYLLKRSLVDGAGFEALLKGFEDFLSLKKDI
jgi:hypothetical protein